MLLLATNTSGKDGSIALARCGANSCEILDVIPLEGGTFSAQLVPQISALLQKHGFSKNDLGGFAVASGPGSFTGLRVGLAAIKALAEILGKPITAVSLLEAVAVAANGGNAILAVLDAGRNEAYVGEYDNGKLGSERLLTFPELIAEAKSRPAVTPDAPLAAKLKAEGATVQEIPRQNSDAIARLGWQKIQAGQTVSPEDLEANYIRRSDAEIFSKPRL